VALVDGDDAGRGYADALDQPGAGAGKVLRWPDGWTLEDVVGWIIDADAESIIGRLRTELAAPPGDVVTLVARLKARDRAQSGLKGDGVAYEIIANALSERPACRIRARRVLHAVAEACAGVQTPHFMPEARAPGQIPRLVQAMSVAAFEGPAGCGKTHRLMSALADSLRRKALASHERVLALTFMHGSRRRLDARLREVDGLAGRFDATTIDRFAWRLTRRWQRLAVCLGHALPAEEDYDATCALAVALLERECVRAWVSLSYPTVIVDEAQDLSRERSLMIKALARSSMILLALDEFQCLNTALLPMRLRIGCTNTVNQQYLEGATAPTKRN
jgi:hypothetical protein